MSWTKKHAPPAPVRAVRKHFENWRKGKQGRERIPEPLWAQALGLCEHHSAHRVSRWLRLNSTALRCRLNSSPAGSPHGSEGNCPVEKLLAVACAAGVADMDLITNGAWP